MALLTRRAASAAKPPAIVRKTEYREFTKDCPVQVRGETGRWRFLCYCANTDTGSEWIDVFGGPSGYETLRAFSLGRVTRR